MSPYSFSSSLASRNRSARYVGAAVTALFVVSSLYYLQLPVGSGTSHRFDTFAPFDRQPSSWHPATSWPESSLPANSPIWDTRANHVKQAFLHAYNGYLTHAAGHDELRPLSNHAVNKYVPTICCCGLAQ